VAAAACPADLEQHLDGIAAIMENHFRYEENKLLPVMETLALDADPDQVLGPCDCPAAIYQITGHYPVG
jgi:hypothetical protein